MKAVKALAPNRKDVLWIDCNLQRGQDMRDVHPLLVLSPKVFNERTSLFIGPPMTTAAYNADNPFAVAVSAAGERKTGQTSYVLCHQPKSFYWRLRSSTPYPMKRIPIPALPRCWQFSTRSCNSPEYHTPSASPRLAAQPLFLSVLSCLRIGAPVTSCAARLDPGLVASNYPGGSLTRRNTRPCQAPPSPEPR